MADEHANVTDDEFESLKAAIRAQHERAVLDRTLPQILRAVCVCGYPSGPGTPACSALRKLTGGA